MRWIALVAVLSGCFSRHLDPAPPPAAVVPNIPLPPNPPQPGTGRVILDVVDGPTPIEIKVQMPGYLPAWRPLCVTPCIADVPFGQHPISLRFNTEKSDADTLAVGPATTVYRRQLTERTESPVLAGIGYGALYVGLNIVLIGLMVTAIEQADGSGGNAGFITMGLGVGLGVAGGFMLYEGVPAVRPGATTQFPVQ